MRTPEEIQHEIQYVNECHERRMSNLNSQLFSEEAYLANRLKDLTAELEAAEAATPKPWPQVGDSIYMFTINNSGANLVHYAEPWYEPIAEGRAFQTSEARDEALAKVKAYLANGCVDPQVYEICDVIRAYLLMPLRSSEPLNAVLCKYPPQEVKA